MDMKEDTIEESLIYDGKIIRVERLTVRLQNGNIAYREVVRHQGAVAILAEPKPGEIVLVSQFRKPIEDELLELPAGKLEPGEEPIDCAIRELIEETGYRANKIELVHSFFTSPGFADEKIQLYYATDLTLGERSPDEDEFVDVELYQKAEILNMLNHAEIQDAKTLIGLLWWCQRSDNT